jgi:peptidoglycan-associated lipoprotein
MRNGRTKVLAVLIGLFCISFALGCHKKVATAEPPPPAPPPPAAPTATLAANPANIERGQSTTLSWQTTNATDITIQGLGTVGGSGTHTVSPSQSATYELVAKGPGGTANASARITVTAPPPPPAPPAPGPTLAELFARNVKDIYFDYNKFDVRSDQMPLVQADAQFVKQYPELRVLIEGNCDERGSAEYNLALGAKRADSVERAFEQLGVPKSQLQSVSYGKERPVCNAHNEECWHQNRRDHFARQ